MTLPRTTLRWARLSAAVALGGALHAGMALTGTVRDAAGRPIFCASVSLRPWTASTLTDSSGLFVLYGTSVGRCARLPDGGIVGLGMIGGVLRVPRLYGGMPVHAELLDLSGKTMARAKGSSESDLRLICTESGKRLRMGPAVLLVSTGGWSGTALVNSWTNARLRVTAHSGPSAVGIAAAGSADTLVVSHVRFVTVRQVLLSLSGAVNIMLAAKSPPYLKLPDTDQRISYTSTPGEDADLALTQPSYTSNGDGTVTDNSTGLVWQEDQSGETSFENAKAYCSRLSLGGHGGWRLPSSHELFNIASLDRFGPALDTAFLKSAVAEYWWSSSAGVEKPRSQWVANAGGGIGAHLTTESKSEGGTRSMCARCVFGDSIPSALLHDFALNGDSTVTDRTTGLVWQRGEAGSMTWEQALAYADTLSLAGLRD